MDEENELKASFQKLSKNFFLFDWTKSISLHQSRKKSVKRCIFSNSINFCRQSHQSMSLSPNLSHYYYYLFSTDQRFLAMTVPEEVGDDCPFGK